MPLSDQGISRERYMLIPRTAIFLRRGDSVLLIKGAPTKRLWAGKYNGLGGHVERGEDVCSAAKRELMEEAGLTADLWLCGTVIVNAGEIGVCLYVFSGESFEGEITASPLGKASKEGTVEWVSFERVAEGLPVVEDLSVILSRIQNMRRGDPPFSARSFYDVDGKLNMAFADSVPFGE